MLGKSTSYEFQYNPTLLNPISRVEGRTLLTIGNELPFQGFDRWTAYEVSWLNEKGLPQVAIVEFDFPCTSPFLIESKSFKLYLNSLNQSVFVSQKEVEDILIRDLSKACGQSIVVRFFPVTDFKVVEPSEYICLDSLDVKCKHYFPASSLLQCHLEFGLVKTQQKLCTHLFRSLCPVTGQPDWASIYIEYKGNMLDHENLLQYLVSYRNHQGFHEQCVEQIFVDLMMYGKFEQLSVNARFLRRGGLDINPYRAIYAEKLQHVREYRQ